MSESENPNEEKKDDLSIKDKMLNLREHLVQSAIISSILLGFLFETIFDLIALDVSTWSLFRKILLEVTIGILVMSAVSLLYSVYLGSFIASVRAIKISRGAKAKEIRDESDYERKVIMTGVNSLFAFAIGLGLFLLGFLIATWLKSLFLFLFSLGIVSIVIKLWSKEKFFF